MMTRFWHATVAALILLAVGQTVSLWWDRQPKTPAGPQLGKPLPDVGLVSVDDQPPTPLPVSLASKGSCTLIVGISPSCGACRRMRDSWRDRFGPWIDSVGSYVRVGWLAAGDSSAMANFYGGYKLDGIERMRLPADTAPLMRRLGVYVTPMVYLLDAQGRLRVGSLGFTLPPVDSARQICRAA